MAAPGFDTLKVTKPLQPTFSGGQAEVLATAFSENVSDQLATKADITELENRLIKWVVSAIAFNLFGTIGTMIALVNW